MRPNHPLRRVLTCCLTVAYAGALVVCGAPAPTHADPRDDAKRADRAVERAAAVLEDATVRARRAATQLLVARSALPAAQQRIAETRGRVAAARVVAHTARRRADAAQARRAQAQAHFDAVQQRVLQARERVGAVAVATYQGSSFAAFNLVATAAGPREAMDRLGYLGQVMRQRQAHVDELTAARREARIAQDGAGAAEREAARAEQATERSLAVARSARDAAVRARAAVAALALSRRRALAVARSERAGVLARYRELKAEEARIVASLRAWERRSDAGARFGGGRLLTPVQGWKSSDFGMRLNPVYGVWRLHAGIDFAAGGGTPIRAAADGRVVRAGWSGGYGKYTCISHGRHRGGGLSTCYGHQSAILVSAGQWVHRGQVVGRVGTTGASTGNHLHFEVRLSGEPRNPLRYLASCLC